MIIHIQQALIKREGGDVGRAQEIYLSAAAEATL